MRIAYVCADPGVPVFGTKGSSVHVQSVLAALLGTGDVAVDLFAMRRGGDAPPALRGVPVFDIPAPTTREPAARELQLAACNLEVRRLLAEHGPYDAIYERHALWAWAAMEHAQVTGIPGLLEVNAPLVEEQARHRALADLAGAREGVARSMAAATAVLAGSGDLARRLPARRDTLHVLPNGVDARRFGPPRPRVARPFTVAFVGTLKPWHGLDVLADAFAVLARDAADARLLIVGDGPGRDGLAARLDRHGLAGQAMWTGAVAPAAVPRLLAGADATVAPYPRDAETYFSPLKVLEGMAAGIPVIASRVGQIPQLIRHDETGLLCPPGDAAVLGAMLCTLAGDPQRARRIGAAGRAWVLRHHTWDGVAARILALAGARQKAAA